VVPVPEPAPATTPPLVLTLPAEPEIPEIPAPAAVPETTPEKLAPFADARRINGMVYQEDNQWQGNLQLDGWITVAPQATLTVSPGTVVRLGSGSGIHILGRIVVKGTPENPVLFTSLSREPLPGEWRGIVLSGSEKKNILDHLRIEGAETALLARFSSFTARGMTIDRAVTGMQLQECVVSLTAGRINACMSGIVADNSELTLERVIMEHNHNAIAMNASSLLATEVTLSGNRNSGLMADGSQLKLDRFTVSGSETGSRITRGEGAITASVFRDNSEAGLVLAGSRLKLTGNRFSGNRIGLQSDDHLPVLWGNALYDNKSYNLLYLGEDSYYAGGNWFGTGIRESSEKTVFSKRHGALQIEPLLTTTPLSGD
jgi:hypothetical protein